MNLDRIKTLLFIKTYFNLYITYIKQKRYHLHICHFFLVLVNIFPFSYFILYIYIIKNFRNFFNVFIFKMFNWYYNYLLPIDKNTIRVYYWTLKLWRLGIFFCLFLSLRIFFVYVCSYVKNFNPFQNCICFKRFSIPFTLLYNVFQGN